MSWNTCWAAHTNARGCPPVKSNLKISFFSCFSLDFDAKRKKNLEKLHNFSLIQNADLHKNAGQNIQQYGDLLCQLFICFDQFFIFRSGIAHLQLQLHVQVTHVLRHVRLVRLLCPLSLQSVYPSKQFPTFCLETFQLFQLFAKLVNCVIPLPGQSWSIRLKWKKSGWHFCCVFWPVTGCFARRLLVKITFFRVFSYFFFKKEESIGRACKRGNINISW